MGVDLGVIFLITPIFLHPDYEYKTEHHFFFGKQEKERNASYRKCTHSDACHLFRSKD